PRTHIPTRFPYTTLFRSQSAGGKGQQGDWDELRGREKLDEERRMALLLDEPRLRDGLHPVADVARERAEPDPAERGVAQDGERADRKSTRLNSSHLVISY